MNKKTKAEKGVVIVHAWDSAPDQHWYQEEKAILENLGYEVQVPVLPGGNWPILDEWLDILNKIDIDEKTILIGHSLGPAAIFRYIELSKQKVDKVICVAGFVRDLGIPETKNFVDKPFDWESIKKLTNTVVSIAQENDPYVAVDISKEISDKADGEFILVAGNNHFDTMDLDIINSRLI